MRAANGFSGLNARKGRPLMERLMERVSPEPNSGCWLWTGGMNDDRYGKAFLPGGKAALAHRAMMIACGADLGPDDAVCHRCDVTLCINPDHLFIGTQADNLADMNQKGRHGKSYAIPLEWRRKIAEDTETPAWAIAVWFGVSPKTVRNIRAGR